MLEVAFLASHLLWMMTRDEIDTLYDLVSLRAGRAMNVPDFELKTGAPANLVVLEEPDTVEALRNHVQPKFVISHGKLIDQDRMRELASSTT